MLRRREWQRTLPGVFRAVHLPGVFRAVQLPISTTGRVYATSLAAGPGAVLTGAAAALWWELTGQEPGLVVLIARPRSGRPRPRASGRAE